MPRKLKKTVRKPLTSTESALAQPPKPAPAAAPPVPGPPMPPPVPGPAAGAILRFIDGQPAVLASNWSERDLAAKAREWNYRLRDRRRWSTRDSGVSELRKQATAFVGTLGCNEAILDRLTRARVVQVDLPAGSNAGAEAIRRLPWEYLLASATRASRGDAVPFTVVRRMRGGAVLAQTMREQRWLIVESSPGMLHDEYDFTAERKVLETSAAACGTSVVPIENPTRETLQTALATKPGFNLVHLSGFDIHQASELIREEQPKFVWEEIGPSTSPTLGYLEGFVLAGYRGAPVAIGATELAGMICRPDALPTLVSCNVYNSGYQLAAEMVAKGAHSAIGFQDTFDDQLAELLFATFYRAWPAAGWDPIAAFNYAWEQVRAVRLPLQGSGVVLWTQQALENTKLITEELLRAHTHEKKVTAENVRELLEAKVDPFPELNYSILHNNGPLFRKFKVEKKDTSVGEVTDIEAVIELNVGTDIYRFSSMVKIGYSDPHYDFLNDVRISLASSLNRGLRENVRTSLCVRVKWRDVTLYHQTHRVTLLSVDEWRDDDENRKWLPSFVLPRDPVVPQIIERAQKYLMALQDDPTAGFDGYQSSEDVKGRNPAEACFAVDQQVRAIWSALIYDTPLAYINPPPTFTDSSQRLRTPSDVIEGKRGTCIDLALLLASCLEYVEIYPAIILLETHAFPAYWRHSDYHEQFGQAGSADATPLPATQDGGTEELTNRGQRFSWYFTRPDHFREIMGEIQAGRLVPVETVSLTARASFSDALSDGYKNLGNRREFDSMLDIQLARSDEQRRVTPLPILRTES